MIIVEDYRDASETEWKEFVAAAPGATIAHEIGFRKVLAAGLGCKPHYLLARSNGAISGVLPLFLVRTWWNARYLVSVPWLDYGGICTHEAESERALLFRAKSLADENGASFIEFRSVEPTHQDLATVTERVTFLVDLSLGAETLWKGFDAKLRNQIRKAQKSELKVEFGGLNFVDEFYRVFSTKMRDLGTPVWSKRLFVEILTKMPDNSEIVLVRRGEETVTGALLLKSKGREYIPSAASYDKFLKLCPYHALYWTVIERGCREGARWFDFGRSSIDSPTYKFKIQWSENPVPLAWQYSMHRMKEVPQINPGNPKYRLAQEVWRHLPLSLANLLGPAVIRNFP